MIRAFASKIGCEVPDTSAIVQDDYYFSSCNIQGLMAAVAALEPFRQSPIFDNPIPPPPKIIDKKEGSVVGGDESVIGIPRGIIVMWNGTVPPDGWALCNGDNGTPDLRSRFIVSYDDRAPSPGERYIDNYSVGDVGGFRYHGYGSLPGDDVVSENNHDDHPVDAVDVATCVGGHDNGLMDTNDAPLDEQHSLTDNRPPFYVLAFIMKL